MSRIPFSISSVASFRETKMLPMTHHAQARLQQRGISHDVIENLLDFSREDHDHRGGCILYFDRPARQQLRRT